jgi:hypothetical protein
MFVVSSGTSPSYIYGASALLGLGFGIGSAKGYSILPALLITPSTHRSATPRAPEPQYVPAAIAFLNAGQIGSIVDALAISGAVFQNSAYKNLLAIFKANNIHLDDVDIRATVAGTRSAVFESLTPEVRMQAVASLVKSISRVYAVSLSASALLVVVSLLMRVERLFQKAKDPVKVEKGVVMVDEVKTKVEASEEQMEVKCRAYDAVRGMQCPHQIHCISSVRKVAGGAGFCGF